MDASQEQCIGMYLGMAIGDALGAPYEFTQPEPFISFQEINMDAGGAHNVARGEWTDDTAMARCIADCYIRFQEFIPEVVYENFCAWEDTGKFGTRDRIFDIGVTCMTAIGNYKQKVGGEVYRGVDDFDAQGNGGIMRLAPVIIANINDRTRCRIEAIESSALTHASPECLAYADRLADDLWQGKYSRPNMEEVFRRNPDNSGRVQDTYFSAWQAVISTGSFEDALKMAVCRGGDSDTIGAVAGMIAGRIYGVDAIPDEWMSLVFYRDKLIEEATDLHTLGMCRA